MARDTGELLMNIWGFGAGLGDDTIRAHLFGEGGPE